MDSEGNYLFCFNIRFFYLRVFKNNGYTFIFRKLTDVDSRYAVTNDTKSAMLRYKSNDNLKNINSRFATLILINQNEIIE